MKLAIDRIENDLAICEDVDTKEKYEIKVSDLPKNIKEGTIIRKNNNKYELDENEEELRRKRIQEKFNRLKKN